MMLFRSFLVLFWLAVLIISIHAFRSDGLIAGEVFIGDIMNGLWRSQFNTDFLAHLLLLGLWASWRQNFSPASWFIGSLCVLGGGLFSLAYLLLLSITHQGNITKILLGKRHHLAN
tara:strand:- start:37502 stop:37849 length:348 start_codon:yes stop_codon:yes gene_type:complete